jgi:membrane protein implicated in regulation of membrane protease activity
VSTRNVNNDAWKEDIKRIMWIIVVIPAFFLFAVVTIILLSVGISLFIPAAVALVFVLKPYISKIIQSKPKNNNQ